MANAAVFTHRLRKDLALMLKILHCADVHLDAPFSLRNPELSEIRRNELRGAFASMFLRVKQWNVDLVLIAGDLFDHASVLPETVKMLKREFASIPDCRFVISPGNHDPYTPYSKYATEEFPDNVYIFREETPSCFQFDDIGATVCGYAFHGQSLPYSPLESYSFPLDGNIRLLCAHADLRNTESSYAPLKRETLERLKIDYAALGHVHNFEGIQRSGSTYYGYAGCFEGRGFDEPGLKGAVYAELTRRADQTISANIKRIRFSKKHYENDTLDISGCSDPAEAAAKIREHIHLQKYDEDTALRITLKGNVSPALVLRRDAIAAQLPALMQFELEDQTRPEIGLRSLEEDPTIRGAYYGALKEKLLYGNEEEKEIAQLALRLGLSVLEGGSAL